MSKAIDLSFLKKMSGKRQTMILAGILAVAITHSIVQLSFIQSENLRSAELTAQIENVISDESAVEIKRPDARIIDIQPEEYKVQKVKIITIRENVGTAARRRAETILPAAKRKIVPETRTARLRRAEKILTGV